MGLDIFEITINNNSSQKKYLDTKNIWLVDDHGNQQNMLNIDYFEKLYQSDKDKRPLRFANIQRTLLASGPIFPGQTRKAFIAFYPISRDAESFNIYVPQGDSSNNNISWKFKPNYLTEEKKFINFGISVNSVTYGGLLGDDSYPIKNVMIFIKPIEAIGISGGGGTASALVNTKYLRNQITIYAIGAGDAKSGEQVLRVLFGSLKFTINPNNTGAEFLEIPVKFYAIHLDY
jgi:hypothetical protein